MDVRAIIIAGADDASSVGNVPLTFFPVLGQVPLRLMAENLLQSGCDTVTVLHTEAMPVELQPELRLDRVAVKQVSDVWRAAEEEFSGAAQGGTELVLVLRASHYMEVDVDALLQFHLDKQARVSRVQHASGALPFFVISASRRNDAAALFRSQMEKSRHPLVEFESAAYAIGLNDPAAMRQLALDSFELKTAMRPVGREVRPGIWVADGARIDKGARLVAPCYVGAQSRIRASAVLTRGTSVEHHSEIDCGSVVENSTVLPCSYIGVGLDVSHSVLRFDQLANIRRKVTLTVPDAHFARALPQAAGARALRHAASLISYLPQQMARALAAKQAEKCPVIADSTTLGTQHIPAAPQSNVSADANSDLVTSGFAVMRRYGK